MRDAFPPPARRVGLLRAHWRAGCSLGRGLRTRDREHLQILARASPEFTVGERNPESAIVFPEQFGDSLAWRNPRRKRMHADRPSLEAEQTRAIVREQQCLGVLLDERPNRRRPDIGEERRMPLAKRLPIETNDTVLRRQPHEPVAPVQHGVHTVVGQAIVRLPHAKRKIFRSRDRRAKSHFR